MATYSDREAFIPLSRSDLLALCLADENFSASQGQSFADFCRILQAYVHFVYHDKLETLKSNFAHLDPDRDTICLESIEAETAQSREQQLSETFVNVLERANYQVLSEADLAAAFEEASMIKLKMEIDFDDFEQMILYWRGATEMPVPQTKWWQKRWQKPRNMAVFKRMVLLLHFKDAAYFEAKDIDLEKLGFTPGKMYLYLYKMIPRQDLEVLFPNVRISMSWRDRLMFILPALGAAIPMLLKALPQLLLIAGVALFLVLGPGAVQSLGLTQGQIQNYLPILVAVLSLGMLFGSFAFKQYVSYKNKKLKFLKDVTDTLFFRNLVCNAGVFHALVDAAEEEEAKEVMLVIYHLLQAQTPLTAEALDDTIEAWLEAHQMHVDFDIQKAITTLKQIQGSEGVLLRENQVGELQLLPLPQACVLLDEVWDQIFNFETAQETSSAF